MEVAGGKEIKLRTASITKSYRHNQLASVQFKQKNFVYRYFCGRRHQIDTDIN
jgi:hypothetical protein